jgi:hypothetical protein
MEMRGLEGDGQKESSMPVKINNDSDSPIGRESRICKTLCVYQLVPVLRGAEIPTSSAEQAASMVVLKANRPSGNDDDPGPAAA